MSEGRGCNVSNCLRNRPRFPCQVGKHPLGLRQAPCFEHWPQALQSCHKGNRQLLGLA